MANRLTNNTVAEVAAKRPSKGDSPCGAASFEARAVARAPQDEESENYIPSAPRAMATTPVRETSTRPSGNIWLMKLSICSDAPVISKM
jgi:hypothetical protein